MPDRPPIRDQIVCFQGETHFFAQEICYRDRDGNGQKRRERDREKREKRNLLYRERLAQQCFTTSSTPLSELTTELCLVAVFVLAGTSVLARVVLDLFWLSHLFVRKATYKYLGKALHNFQGPITHPPCPKSRSTSNRLRSPKTEGMRSKVE